MAYLIDGNNLIGHTPSLNLRDPISKHRLVSKLRIFQKVKMTKVTLVFDGPPEPNLLDKKFQTKRFSIVYPSEDENADDVIKKIILKQSDRRRFFVVSSDREIKSFAKARGAKALSSKEFNKELVKVLKEYKKSLETTKKDTPLTALEINHWLEIFGTKND